MRPKIIYKVLNDEGLITWPDIDKLLELSKENEVFIEDPNTKELIQVLDLKDGNESN